MFVDPLEMSVPLHAAAAPRPGDAAAQAGGRLGDGSLSRDDAARFRRLVDTQFDFVWRFLRGLGVSEAGIDDAAQHVFWITAQRLARITPGSERAFLLSTARGVAANARRASARRREVTDEGSLEAQVDPGQNPEQLVAATEARRSLDAVLDGLPEEMRAVFVLFELEGETMAAIAQLLAVPPGTVASRLRRAREAFHAAAAQLNREKEGAP